MDQRHLYEPWYHGRLPDGRNTGDHLLAQHSHLGPATFLVRESDTFVGSYTLSFWSVLFLSLHFVYLIDRFNLRLCPLGFLFLLKFFHAFSPLLSS